LQVNFEAGYLELYKQQAPQVDTYTTMVWQDASFYVPQCCYSGDSALNDLVIRFTHGGVRNFTPLGGRFIEWAAIVPPLVRQRWTKLPCALKFHAQVSSLAWCSDKLTSSTPNLKAQICSIRHRGLTELLIDSGLN
jgi:hypothetical protein